MEVAVGRTDFDLSEEDIGCRVCSVRWVSSQAERNMRKIAAIVVEAVDVVVEAHMMALAAVRFRNSNSLHRCLHLQAQRVEELKRSSDMVVNMEQKPYPSLRMAARGHRIDRSCSCALRAFDRSSGLLWIV